MKSVKSTTIPAGVVFVLLMAFFVFSQDFSHAASQSTTPASSAQLQKKVPVSAMPAIKPCPDLKVSLKVIKGNNGLVTLIGSVSNVGSANYAIPSEAQVIMNLAYPPKTYNQSGVSEQIFTKAFSTLNKGASFPVNCTFQIPNFEGWGQTVMKRGIAKRLFTLRVVKKDMSPFKAGEDCNPNNNDNAVEVTYQEK